jgi:putative membrane protein
MKNIWLIFKRDIKLLLHNPFAMVIIVALMILPSLYAWFNIEASWDPYGNTEYIKVAVYSEDEGAKLFNIDLNVGDKVIAELKANKKIGWQFVDKETLMDGVNDGTYYAGIIIPKDFSKNFVSITTQDISRPELEYYVNAKSNAIAPKITDSGINTLQEEINETFVNIASEIVLTLGQNFDEKFNIYDTMDTLSDRLTTAASDINTLLLLLNTLQGQQSTLNNLNDLTDQNLTGLLNSLSQANSLINTTQQTINSGQDFANELGDVLDSSIAELQTETKSILRDANEASGSLDDVSYHLERTISTLTGRLKTLYNNVTALQKSINNINDKLPIKLSGLTNTAKNLGSIATNLNKIYKNLNSAADDLEGATGGAGGALTTLAKALVNVSNDLDLVYDDFKDDVKPQLSETTSEIQSALSGLDNLLNQTQTTVTTLQNTLPSISQINNNTFAAITNLRILLTRSQSDLKELNSKISEERNSDALATIIDLLANDPKLAAEFIASPVEVNKIELYPMANYGAGMTPFYTILCLWVGNMLLMSLVKTSVKEDEQIHDLTQTQAYFGRGLLFLVIALIQGLLASLGDIFLLGVQMAHPALFVLICLFTSFIFCSIVFGFVSSLGDVGKAVCIVLLVLQVAGSGGTFPIEVTPLFFKIINPLLPFTYAINAAREAVGGIYLPNLIKDLVGLTCFFPVSLLFGVIFKNALAKLTHLFNEKVEETGIF